MRFSHDHKRLLVISMPSVTSSPGDSKTGDSSTSYRRASSLDSISPALWTLLTSYALHDTVQTGLYNDATHNHLSKHRMHRLVSEDEIQLADVLKKAIQRLDEDLDQVYKGKR